MSTTLTTQLGPNTWAISYALNAAMSDIITAMDTVIASNGWVKHDAAAGPNAICYSALNKDGLTSKYVVVDFNTAGRLYIKPYETWDNVAHTGTGAAPMATDATYSQLLNTTTDKGIIYLYVNPRYLAVIIRQYSSAVLGNTTACGATGVFEFARDNPDDTPATGFPVHALVMTGVLGENTSTSLPSLTLCRTKSGTSGASLYGEVSTVFGKTSYNPLWNLKNMIPNSTSLFSGKDWAISMYVQDGTLAAPSVRGRMFGLKIFTQDKLNFMDKIQVPVDEDFNYDPNGSLVDHFIVPGGRQGSGLYNVRFLVPA